MSNKTKGSGNTVSKLRKAGKNRKPWVPQYRTYTKKVKTRDGVKEIQCEEIVNRRNGNGSNQTIVKYNITNYC